jgi:hypothetical protein
VPALASRTMGEEDWRALGVRAETVDAWRALGADAFTAALAEGDGYGPSSARHSLAAFEALARRWRAIGMDEGEALRWHRAGFSAREAAKWSARAPLERAALAAGHRMVG